MTAQITDTVIWNQKKYELLSFKQSVYGGHGLFRPENYGMVPEMISTNCYRGFYCTYRITQKTLFLENLTIRTQDEVYPTLNGIHAASDDVYWRYNSLSLAIEFSGIMRLASDFIPESCRNMGFQETTSYRSVVDLTIIRGKLTAKNDVSEYLQNIRDVQAEVQNFISSNWIAIPWIEKLKRCYGYVDYNDISDMFSQYVRKLDPQEPLRLIQEILLQNKTLPWFITNYFDYFERVHSYDHTFSHLKYLGIPPNLLNFLESQINTNNSEEQVVLALLKVLIDTEAQGKWGESLPVIFERQYLRAQIDPALTDAIRRELKISGT